MKNLKIYKIYYRKNTVGKPQYKIVIADKMPEFTSNVVAIEFRDMPKAIAKHIIINKSLSKKYYTIIWKLSYPKLLLHRCKCDLNYIKHNITEFYKWLTTKDYIVPEYKFTRTDTGEMLKDWKEVLKDMWRHIKHGHIPPVYVFNMF